MLCLTYLFVLNRYPDANNKENDIEIMSTKLPFVSDEAGDNTTSARPLTLSEPVMGTIGFNGDVDVFSFTSEAGKRVLITFGLVDDYMPSESQYYQRTNLNGEITLYDATGAVLDTWGNDLGIFYGRIYTAPLGDAVRLE